jgi:hypothetical protein
MSVAEVWMAPTTPDLTAATLPGALDALPVDASRAAFAVAVVTTDADLVATLRDAAPDATIVAIDAPQGLAEMLVARSCRALFLDLTTVGGSSASLVSHLAGQFPDVPVVAVGTRDDEPLVAPLVTTGEVYRLLHRPVSLERARTFVAAALRRADDLERARPPPPPPEPARAPVVERAPPPPRRLPPMPPGRSTRPRSNVHAVAFAGTALAFVLATGAAWWSRPAPKAISPVAPVALPVVDPVGAANAAAGRGELIAPAGTCAADLFREALARRPDDVEARVSLLNHASAMLAAGERALVDGRIDEAARAADTVALVRPRDPRVAALREQVGRARAARSTAALDAAAASAIASPGTATGTRSSTAPGVTIPRPSGPNTDERAGYEEFRTVETVRATAGEPRAIDASAVPVPAPSAGATPEAEATQTTPPVPTLADR